MNKKEQLIKCFGETQSITKTGELMGMHRNQVHRLIKKYGLKFHLK